VSIERLNKTQFFLISRYSSFTNGSMQPRKKVHLLKGNTHARVCSHVMCYILLKLNKTKTTNYYLGLYRWPTVSWPHSCPWNVESVVWWPVLPWL